MGTAATWTDTLTADTTVIKPVHVTELRTALSAVYTALGVTPPTFTDATLSVDTALIKAVHLQEVRAAHATIAAATLTAKAYYHLDAIGSVRALTSSTGAELERHDYTAFGEELTAPTGLDTRRFGGKERDPETGLAYFAARYYAPETGRFAQADDPGFGNVFDPQSLNQYGYTSGNPLRWVDPSGHQAQCVPSPTTVCVSAPLPPDVVRWTPFPELPTRLAARAAQVRDWINAPRDPACMASFAGGGASIGGTAGGLIGGVGGALGGAAGGTLVVPGVGTLGGGAAGALVGASEGTAAGVFAGSAVGTGIGSVACMGSGGGQGSANSGPTADQIISQSKKGSIRQAFPEQYLNKTLDEIRRLARSGEKAAQTALKLLTDNRFSK